MLSKLIKIGTLGAFALSTSVVFAQSVNTSANPNQNGRSQSESVGGENRNGAVATDEPTHKHKKSHIQQDTNPKKNGASQSESPSGDMKNGQPQQ